MLYENLFEDSYVLAHMFGVDSDCWQEADPEPAPSVSVLFDRERKLVISRVDGEWKARLVKDFWERETNKSKREVSFSTSGSSLEGVFGTARKHGRETVTADPWTYDFERSYSKFSDGDCAHAARLSFAAAFPKIPIEELTDDADEAALCRSARAWREAEGYDKPLYLLTRDTIERDGGNAEGFEMGAIDLCLKASPSTSHIVAAPSRFIPMMIEMEMLDGLGDIIVAPKCTKKSLSKLEAAGWKIAYMKGRKEQANEKLSALTFKGSNGTYKGPVGEDVKRRWLKEVLVGAFWDANKEAKKFLPLDFGKQFDGNWYADAVGWISGGLLESYSLLAEMDGGDIREVFHNVWDTRLVEFISREYGWYEFCDFEFCHEGEYARALEDASKMAGLLKVWDKGLAAARKKSAFKKAVEAGAGDLAKAKEIGDAAGVKQFVEAYLAGVPVEDIVC